jgi:hypothetical protein
MTVEFWGCYLKFLNILLLLLLLLLLWIYSTLLDLDRFFNYLIVSTANRAPWTRDQPIARPLPTQSTTQSQNKRTQTYVPLVTFEPTTPVFEQAKTVYALDQCCPTFLCTRAQFTDAYGGAGATTLLLLLLLLLPLNTYYYYYYYYY